MFHMKQQISQGGVSAGVAQRSESALYAARHGFESCFPRSQLFSFLRGRSPLAQARPTSAPTLNLKAEWSRRDGTMPYSRRLAGHSALFRGSTKENRRSRRRLSSIWVD